MRFQVVVSIAVLLLVSPALFAQSNRVSIYVTNPGITSGDYFGTHYTGGGGLSLSRFWTPRFSTEIAAGAESDYSGYVSFNRDGSVRDKQQFRYTTYPLDLLAQLHFPNASRWTPYVGAGLRYAHRPRRVMTGTQLAPELNGGVVFRMRPRLGLVVDGRLSGARSVSWAPMFRPSVGLSWKF